MGSTRKISAPKKLLFAFAALVLFMVFLEGYARVRTYLDTGNVKYLYTTPYEALRFGLGPLPYRGREVSVKKPPGVFRVAALGGSTTFGWGIESDSDTWPAQLEAILNRKVRKTRVEVINFGEPHATSEVVLKRRFPVAKRYRPDFYILFSGYNDYDKSLRTAAGAKKGNPPGTDDAPATGRTRREQDPGPGVRPRPEERERPAEPGPGLFRREDLIERVTLFILGYSVFAQRLRELIAKVWYKDIDYFYKRERRRSERRKAAAAKRTAAVRPMSGEGAGREGGRRKAPVRGLIPPPEIYIDLPAVIGRFKANLARLLENVRAEGAGAMMMTLPVQWNHPGARHILQSGSLDALNGAIREIAAARKIPVCDIEGAFKRQPDSSQFFIRDYIHPDQNGARLIAETLADCLGRAEVLSP